MDRPAPVSDRAALAIALLVAHLAERAEVRRAVLFGSRARGDHAPRSDIDLAVEAPDASPHQWQEIQELIDEAETLLPIDRVRLDRAPAELRERIAAEGRVLLER